MEEKNKSEYVPVSERLKLFRPGMIKTVEHYPTGIQKLDQMLGGGLCGKYRENGRVGNGRRSREKDKLQVFPAVYQREKADFFFCRRCDRRRRAFYGADWEKTGSICGLSADFIGLYFWQKSGR